MITLNENEILVLQICNSNGKFYGCYGGFDYSLEIGAIVTAPYWNPEPVCSGGLYGLPWGVGNLQSLIQLVFQKYDITWALVAVNSSVDYIHGLGDLTDKCKFRTGRIVFFGSRSEAVDILQKYAPINSPIVHARQYADDKSVQIGGVKSVQASGNWSEQIADDDSIQATDNYSTQTCGHWSTQIGKEKSTQTAGDESTQTAGDESTQTSGDGSMQTASDKSTQTAGYESTQTSGDESIQITGTGSIQITGNKSYQYAGLDTIQITHWHDNGFHKAMRVIGDYESKRWYYVENGVWTKKNPSSDKE